MLLAEDVNPETLSATIDPASLARGVEYFESDRATVHEAIDSIDQVTLYGDCQGSGGRVYEQSISLWNDGHLQVSGRCTCPVGYNCKHVAALCLAWAWLEDDEVIEPIEPIEPARPIADWLDRLQPAEQGTTAPRPGTEALLYELVPSDSIRSGGDPAINLVISRLKKNGDWGKGRGVSAYIAGGHDVFSRPKYLQGPDRDITALLIATDRITPGYQTVLDGVAGTTALDLMLQSNRLFMQTEGGRIGPFRPGGHRPLGLHWAETRDGGYELRLDTGVAGSVLTRTSPPHYVDTERLEIGVLDLPGELPADALPALQSAPRVDREQAREVSRKIALTQPGLPTPEPVGIEEWHEPLRPRARLHLDPLDSARNHLDVEMRYGGLAVPGDSSTAPVTLEVGTGLARIHRDREAEDEARRILADLGLIPDPSGTTYVLDAPASGGRQALTRWIHLLDEAFPRLRERGWDIGIADDDSVSLRAGERIDANVEQAGNDWFDLRFDLLVDGESVPLLPLLDQVLEAHDPGNLPETVYLETEPGRYLKVAGHQIAPILQTILDLHEQITNDEALRLARPDAPRVLDLGETLVDGDASILDMARRLNGFESLRPVTPPSTFAATLRPYQHQGLDWLQFLREHAFGGILADDMGLGKTVQTLAHLSVEKAAGRLDRPALVVAPTSLMENWRREAGQFTPDLDVLVFHGPDRHRRADAIGRSDIVLTTYPLLARDRDTLSEQAWHMVILDEAQQIKNPRSQAARLVRTLDTRHRLCLTGTPIENHLGELWAQFDFLMPGFLGDRKTFSRRYRTPVERHGDQAALERLRRRVRPFMLRRTKDQVASELPEKTEMIRTVPLQSAQATLYESIRLAMEKRVREAIAAKGLARSHITVLDALLKLRQVCCDPRLLPSGLGGHDRPGSAKLDLLMDLLSELVEEDRRILVFSQFTTMLGLIENELNERDITYTKLTGRTRKRDAAIQRFRRGEAQVFLISLKAGGVGLNLTEADTVIHFDPWWNPAVEAQATDRAHRIGQSRPVFVYKLVTEGTVEQKILELQERKRRVTDSVHGPGSDGHEPPIDETTIQALLETDLD